MATLTNTNPQGLHVAARVAEADAVNGSCTAGLLDWVLGPLSTADDRLGEQPKVRGAGNPEPAAVH